MLYQRARVRQNVFASIVAVAALTSLSISPAKAVTTTVLHSFNASPTGALPLAPLTLGSDGMFYGTGSIGGAFGAGTVYRTTTSGYVRTLHSFHRDDGDRPFAGLLQVSPGLFYGTTYAGGRFGNGVLFSITASGHYRLLHSFTNAEGSSPRSRLIVDKDGYLYGTLEKGGTNSNGALFRTDLDGHVTIVHNFNGTDGGSPAGFLVTDNSGAVYGSTLGPSVVYKYTPSNGKFGVLSDLSSVGVAYPNGGITEGSDHALYGTTAGGGSEDYGTAFRVTKSGSFKIIHNFGDNSDIWPYSGLLADGRGNFYGATVYGEVYRLSERGRYTRITRLTSEIGEDPREFAFGPDGQLYGVATAYGTGDGGSLYKIANGRAVFLRGFATYDGVLPTASITRSGNLLLGVTFWGGRYGLGTIYRYNLATKDYAVLRSFSGHDGAFPSTALVPDGSGGFIGATRGGGPAFTPFDNNGSGVLYRITNGGFRLLHTFTETDGPAPSVLVAGPGGTVYGGAARGGAGNAGTVFKVNASGQFTILHTFGGADGYGPTALTFDKNGNLFGVGNTIFKLTPTGNFSVLHALDYTEGADINGLTLIDGQLYGTAQYGGANYIGSIIRCSTDGEFVVLHNFTGSEGANPLGPLVLDHDGILYGATNGGGAEPATGTIFRMTGDGQVTPVLLFNRQMPIGFAPATGLTPDDDGDRFFGTTTYNGVSPYYGTLYEARP